MRPYHSETVHFLLLCLLIMTWVCCGHCSPLFFLSHPVLNSQFPYLTCSRNPLNKIRARIRPRPKIIAHTPEDLAIHTIPHIRISPL